MSVTVGDSLPPFTIERISPEGMRDWSVFLADPNPIHLDVEAVRAKGLGDKRINQGPINVAYVINMLLAAFPGGRIEAMDSRFLDNVYEGDRVTATGTVTAVEGNRVSCTFTLDVDGRGTVNSGTATIAI
ncbi:MaoC/PaaZ C-terminal domain-containing protein [Novosphingobium sp. Fuku2-ISO-50]|uniref:MaoC family dehydratase n=1 Tax=Novosphingobium sp. Fuku2-ISO-50 TaxID=1739114 RepID=UPI00076DB1D0|nr:MaoC/PaaZ C-terminal domain-containing protein [Novosphingobium sp. Fuku2-ISO-50]KUR76694.1 dehydratase [Novosphingobium sp. Fuku2-ISO-50]